MLTDQKTAQYIEREWGTRYPHLDVNQGSISKFKGLFSSINPFSLEQVPSENRMSFAPFAGRRFYLADPLPNPVRFSRFLPVHYDPVNDLEYKAPEPFFGAIESSGTQANFAVNTNLSLPIACTRYLKFYQRCKLINGGEKCGAEEREFLAVCPNFALNELRQSKIFKQKARIVQRKDYHKALEVSDYNQGRSMKDFDDRKRWVDGTASRLRPDSIWADERYINVTEEDVTEAKKRHAARLQEIGYVADKTLKHPRPISTEYEVFSVDKPIYP